MGEHSRVVGAEEMATTSTAVTTLSPQPEEEPVERVATITLRAPHTEVRKKVVWTEDTVDNEHMNKKKSKCCCIYHKPTKFGESDSEDESDDECEHCFGHVEAKKKKGESTKTQDGTSTSTVQQEEQPREPTIRITIGEEPEPAPTPPDGHHAQP